MTSLRYLLAIKQVDTIWAGHQTPRITHRLLKLKEPVILIVYAAHERFSKTNEKFREKLVFSLGDVDQLPGKLKQKGLN